ncbi:MAG: Nicotinamide-nucleotide adenylyltransferase [Candidatus Peregrinibacteria bacterium GW2011_GWA2_47_7]|nr:MAG: Nicotinamide-nucleotide adenylyltransferase [Candidatus Peregrinibacteria bacterium GW2011_GWA2_47_7]
MNKNLPALFIGRFQPFHKGHLDALSQIVARENKIIIGIGSAQYSLLPENPFTVEDRTRMIAAALAENPQIQERIQTIIPAPDVHEDAAWVAHVEKLLPVFGAVYTGSPEVKKLFAAAGTHEVKNLEMRKPISATEVRRRMKNGENWKELLPKSVSKILKEINAK